jgi:putative ABC transport system substrate-binding protein
VGDPVAQRIVARLNQPGGNITGFALYEPTLGGKWLELLSEITPGLKRAAIVFNSDTAQVSIYMPSLEMRPGHSRSCQSLRRFIAT